MTNDKAKAKHIWKVFSTPENNLRISFCKTGAGGAGAASKLQSLLHLFCLNHEGKLKKLINCGRNTLK